jgi:predicted amino acid racemase
VTAPRLEVDLTKIEANTRSLVGQLGTRGIAVTAITKATLGSPAVAAAMLRGGASGLGDSRLENLARLSLAEPAVPRTLIRSPMLSQVAQAVRTATQSLNSSLPVLEALDAAARRQRCTHNAVLMVELGDLREGVAPQALAGLVEAIRSRSHLRLAGLGTNLACHNGEVPDDRNMGDLSRLVEQVEAQLGTALEVVSGGNSANLPWALSTSDVGRINELRLGEAILLGTEPLHRTVLPGLHADAFRLIAEVIEVEVKATQPWGDRAQTAFGELPAPAATAPAPGAGTTRQAILALGRQDVDLDGLVPPPGIKVLGMNSDHLVLDLGDHRLAIGEELGFDLGYGGLVRAMTSPFVAKLELRPRLHGTEVANPGNGAQRPEPGPLDTNSDRGPTHARRPQDGLAADK